jgi:hypothetical protein
MYCYVSSNANSFSKGDVWELMHAKKIDQLYVSQGIGAARL